MEETAVKKCWCGGVHSADGRNGSVKHWAMNWTLYQIRADDLKRAHKPGRKQEVKDVYAEWTERVNRGYSEEKLRRFFDDSLDFKSGLVEAVASFKPVLIILETRGTLYDLFLPLVLQHLVEEIGYQVDTLRFLCKFYLSPGGSSEQMNLYLGYLHHAERVSNGGGLASEH